MRLVSLLLFFQFDKLGRSETGESLRLAGHSGQSGWVWKSGRGTLTSHLRAVSCNLLYIFWWSDLLGWDANGKAPQAAEDMLAEYDARARRECRENGETLQELLGPLMVQCFLEDFRLYLETIIPTDIFWGSNWKHQPEEHCARGSLQQRGKKRSRMRTDDV